MTTKIVVDAHAGWPVEVTMESQVMSPTSEPDKTITTVVVEPNSEQHFYIHDGMSITGIRELDHPDHPSPSQA